MKLKQIFFDKKVYMTKSFLFCLRTKVSSNSCDKSKKYLRNLILSVIALYYQIQIESMSIKNFKKLKTKWNLQEQQALQFLIENTNLQNWKLIAQKINEKFPGKKKSAKQCREHYVNFIKVKQFPTNPLGWSEEQTNILFQKYMEKGSKWVQIANFLPGRSQNTVKNYFYGSLRKLLRRINKTKKILGLKNKKEIQQSSLLKLLQFPIYRSKQEGLDGQYRTNKHWFIWNLKYDLLRMSCLLQHEVEGQKINDLILRIEQFKSMTRFQSLKNKGIGAINKKKGFPPLFSSLDSSIQAQSTCLNRINEQERSRNKAQGNQEVVEKLNKQYIHEINQESHNIANQQKQFSDKAKQRVTQQQFHDIFIFSYQMDHENDDWCLNFLQ